MDDDDDDDEIMHVYVCRSIGIDPFTVFVAILVGGQSRLKLQQRVWEIVQLSNLVTPLLYNGV